MHGTMASGVLNLRWVSREVSQVTGRVNGGGGGGPVLAFRPLLRSTCPSCGHLPASVFDITGRKTVDSCVYVGGGGGEGVGCGVERFSHPRGANNSNPPILNYLQMGGGGQQLSLCLFELMRSGFQDVEGINTSMYPRKWRFSPVQFRQSGIFFDDPK